MGYYDGREPTRVVRVLGVEYRLFLDVPEDADEILAESAGYCDNTSRIIAIARKNAECNLDDWDVYKKRIIRHELIHAFLFESGLGADAAWQIAGQAHPEQTVDWFARQFPKLLIAFEDAGAL